MSIFDYIAGNVLGNHTAKAEREDEVVTSGPGGDCDICGDPLDEDDGDDTVCRYCREMSDDNEDDEVEE